MQNPEVERINGPIVTFTPRPQKPKHVRLPPRTTVSAEVSWWLYEKSLKYNCTIEFYLNNVLEAAMKRTP